MNVSTCFFLYRSELIVSMKNGPYALDTNGSNDEVFNTKKQKVSTQLLDMCGTKKGDAETLFSTIDETLSKVGVSWDNCVDIGMDNTSVNLGRNNSIMTRVLAKNDSIYVNGCPCHIVHNTANKSASSFALGTGFDIEDVLVDVFHWFDKSSKRKVTLEGFCEFMEQEYKKIIKCVSTRWLSLESAVTCCLKLYPFLKSYFLSVDEKGPRFERLVTKFTDPMTELYMYFYQFSLQSFIRFNLYL